MKIASLRSCTSALLLTAGLVAATFPAAAQSILININQSDIHAVTFTATANNALANDSSQYTTFGVDLYGFFTATTSSGGTVTGNLIPAGTTLAYGQWLPDNLHNANVVDLNLYSTATPQLQTFSTSSRGFTGTAVIDLSAFLATLPASGAAGNIYAGDARNPNGLLIGRWTVVPEPPVGAQVALGAMLLAGLALFRRTRNASARR